MSEWSDGPEFETPPPPKGEFMVRGYTCEFQGGTDEKRLRIKANSEKEAKWVFKYLKREFLPIDPDCV